METVTIEEKLTAALALIDRVMREADALGHEIATLPLSSKQAMLGARVFSLQLSCRQFLRGDPEDRGPDEEPPTNPGTPVAKRNSSAQGLRAVRQDTKK